MSLNPAFESSSTRKLPTAYGYVLGQGDLFLTTVAQDGSAYNLYLLGEGEWDGPEMANTYGNPTGAITSQMLPLKPSPTGNLASVRAQVPTILHFHSGGYSVKNAGFMPTSQGPDQGYDTWYQNFPTVTPGQCFSGIAYTIWSRPAPSGFVRGTYTPSTISGVAIWRSMRCRIFDANGHVLSYGFTCNPVWHRVDAILRYKLKVQQAPLAGLSAAEKALFNWESIFECAARNDFILANGRPRFVGNYLFASQSTLANMLETMMRVDRSFMRTQGGQIYMIGDDPRPSIFVMSASHLVPDSLNLSKKDVSKLPTVFVPRYRDIDVPAVCQVDNVTFAANQGQTVATFLLNAPSPFNKDSFFVYGGSSNPSVEGDYAANGNIASGNTQIAAFGPPGTQPPATATGGYVGSHNARFSDRSPASVRHLSAQKMVPIVAPGVTGQPRITPVFYDFGNSTYDQTNRLMKFERDRSLGTDIGPGWVAPISGTLTAYLEAVDASGKALIDCGVRDVITLDEWVFPERPGDYEIMEAPEILPPSGDSLGHITLQLHQYNRNAATDVSDPPSNSYIAVPGTSLQLTGFTPVPNPAWTLRATPSATTASDGTVTVTIADLLMQIIGIATPTAYPGFVVTGIPSATPVALYITDPNGLGVGATYGFVAAAGGPLLPLGDWVVLYATFTASAPSSGSGGGGGGGGGGGAPNYNPNSPPPSLVY